MTEKGRGRIDWFRLNRELHRDVGYFIAVLTALYALSGLAVNHIDDWNPSYAIDERAVDVGPLPEGLDAAERHVVERLRLDPAEVRGRHRPNPRELKVFLPDGGEVRVETATGKGTLERVSKRPLLFEANLLHLNTMKGAWTFVADGLAVFLLFMSVGGLFMVKGKHGFTRRGAWFALAGLLVPVGFLVAYYLR
jgi:hypothetical protein